MKEPINVKGTWWLPESKEKKLHGSLSFSQSEGAILDLTGVFSAQPEHNENPKIILGISQAGKLITLYQCQYSSWVYPLIGSGNAKYRVKFVFEGVHFEKEDEIKFHQICGNYTDLDAWVDIYGFTIKQENINEKFITSVRYEKPSTQYFEIGNSLRAGVGFSSHGPESSIVQTNVRITQQAYLIISSKNKEDVFFNNLFKKLNIFSYLLQFASQRMVYPVSILGYSQGNARAVKDGNTYYPEINIYYQPIEALKKQKPRIPHEMLYTFKNDLDENHITNWFNSFEEFQIPIHLYRSLFYSDRLFIQTKFLNIVQALESLYGIQFGSRNLPHDEFVARRNKILGLIPNEDQEWVGNALNNANYKSFRVKILELLELKSFLLTDYIDDFNHFSKRIRDTRNEFVHHSKQRWTFEIGEELFSAIELLTILFEAFILGVIGFSDKKAEKLLSPKLKSYLSGWKHLRSMK